jgi:hypothetical protein
LHQGSNCWSTGRSRERNKYLRTVSSKRTKLQATKLVLNSTTVQELRTRGIYHGSKITAAACLRYSSGFFNQLQNNSRPQYKAQDLELRYIQMRFQEPGSCSSSSAKRKGNS